MAESANLAGIAEAASIRQEQIDRAERCRWRLITGCLLLLDVGMNHIAALS